MGSLVCLLCVHYFAFLGLAMLCMDVERVFLMNFSLSTIQETMYPQRCISSGPKEEGERKSDFLLPHERYHVSQT